jgi:hypothetical protein
MTDYLRARNECGISQSVRLAERWFNELATEYIKLWSPGDGYELFASWLEVLQRRVLTDAASIWGESEKTKLWYETVCAPAVRVAVSGKLSEFERVARGKELAVHVVAGLAEDEFSKPEDAVTPTEPMTEERESQVAPFHSDGESHENVPGAAPREVAQERQMRSIPRSPKFGMTPEEPFHQAELLDLIDGPDKTLTETEHERVAAVSEPDPDGRKTAYDQYKRACRDAGVTMTEEKLAKLANRRWNTRDPIMKWKSGKDRPGDDERIRKVIAKGPPAS